MFLLTFYLFLLTFYLFLSTFYLFLFSFYQKRIIFSGNLKFILELIEPKFVFVNEREAILIENIAREENKEIKIVTFEKIPKFTSLDEILSQQNSSEIDEFSCTKPNSAEDECFLIFTSGSSGEPKPTLHLYRSVMGTLLMCLAIKKREPNVSLNGSPLGWLIGIINVVLDLVSISTKIIVHEKGHEPEEILRFIEKYKVRFYI